MEEEKDGAAKPRQFNREDTQQTVEEAQRTGTKSQRANCARMRARGGAVTATPQAMNTEPSGDLLFGKRPEDDHIPIAGGLIPAHKSTQEPAVVCKRLHMMA